MKTNRKRVLITGGARGIGLSIAKAFSKTDCDLILTDIDQKELERAANELRAQNISVHPCVVNVSNYRQVRELAHWVIRELGGLDILINNAGIGEHAELAETDIEKWSELISVNLLGPLYHIYAFLPHFQEKGDGHIVNISSGQAFFRLPTWGAYASIKGALGILSEILHFELRKYGIRVTTVYPFMVKNTGFYDHIETETLGGKLSMRLLPLYSMAPDKVGQIIFNAITKDARVERVSILNYIGLVLQSVPVATVILSRISNFFLAKRLPVGKNTPDKKAPDLRGFSIKEVMVGEHEFTEKFGSPGRKHLEFSVTWGSNDLFRYLNPASPGFLACPLAGTITIEGLCNQARCTGTLELRYFKDHTIRYVIEFEVNGELYYFIGKKMNIYPWNLPWSHTSCFGSLIKTGTGELVSTSLTHFRFRDLFSFLASLRLTRTSG